MSTAPTGDLQRLTQWWSEHGPQPERRVAWIVDPVDEVEARLAVDRAVDSGSNLIALLAHGSAIAARATISLQAKVTPVQVLDQPADLSDIEWMRQVAAIRDLRAGGEPHAAEPAIAAVASLFIAARERATPVLFDGLTAHAGAMSTQQFDSRWLPASSATDPAIEVAQQYWRVLPAIDLKLRADDDLGLRAVLALWDVVDGD